MIRQIYVFFVYAYFNHKIFSRLPGPKTYLFVYFISNIPFITNNKNATTTAYVSLVIAKNNTTKILITIDTIVIILLHLSIPNFVSNNLMIPVTTSIINIIQYNKRFIDVICVYANKFTE